MEIQKTVGIIKHFLFLFTLALTVMMVYAFVDNNLAVITNKITWYSGLSVCGKIFYKVYLGFTIYNSIALICIIVMSSNILYRALRDNTVKKPVYGQVWNTTFRTIGQILLHSIIYSVFYFWGLITIVINDQIDNSNNIQKVLALDRSGSILIIGIGTFVVLVLGILVYLPLYEFYNYANRCKTEIVEQIDNKMKSEANQVSGDLILYREAVLKQKVIQSSAGNNVVAFITLVTPVLSLIIGLIQ